ncbi:MULTISPECIES: hypothetical protein [Acetobacter]|uniref:Uncharacterized protein n=1 Tax=Acetobacter senegalensis TaxID=446692 RepID=A0A0U5EVZ5_9PROT|nr:MULTISPECIES: hypothetical protein [Acetobacter]MCC6104483.1 hypothetical protein [Acetobacter sp.]MCG4259175.1 hypothetical protein [Acetobacter senegalensis]CEF39736.1 hypothetical protein ASN_302 [Acetobacter senegalensis]
MRSASVRVVAALALCGSWSLTACAQSPLGPVTGEVSFHTRSADLGLGYTWGTGVLTYGGRTYPFSVKGASAAAVGYSSGDSVGKVYNLQRIEDFQGTFWALSGEATVGRGVSGVLMENDNGVRIRLDYTRSGARFAASPSRLTVRLLKPSKPATESAHPAPGAHS